MLGLAACGGAEPAADLAAEAAALQIIADEVREESMVTALGIAIVRADGPPQIAVSGERVRGAGDPVQADDLWHLGSNTKAMTALLYADLVEQGELSWDASLPDLFPDFADTMHPAWSDVTIEHLLSHRAGVGDVDTDWLQLSHMSAAPMTEQRAATVRAILSGGPVNSVGDYAYSNLGYIIAGAAMEQATGQPWEDLMRAGLPGDLLGEDHWGFGPPQGAQPEGHYMAGLTRTPAGQTWMSADNPRALGPAGTVHASLESWAGFARAFLPGAGLLSEEARLKLTSPPAPDAGYALGWGLYSDESGTVLQHAGSNTMWLAQIMIMPEDDVAILVVTNEFNMMADTAVRAATTRAGKLAMATVD